MNNYREISVEKAYRLVNHGPLVLLSTKSENGQYNIAPIAWNCPVRKNPSKILLAVGRSHMTYENINKRKSFIVCVPSASMAGFVRYAGSVSGAEEEKFKKSGVETQKGEKVDALIPAGMVGYIECLLDEDFQCGGLSLFVGKAIKAGVDEEGFTDRVFPERETGRTLHHLGGGEFGIISPEIDSGK